jgi:hypothetical protein
MKGHIIQLPKEKGQKQRVQTMDYKILHRKLKTGDHHVHLKQGVDRKRTSSCSNSVTLAMNLILSQE